MSFCTGLKSLHNEIVSILIETLKQVRGDGMIFGSSEARAKKLQIDNDSVFVTFRKAGAAQAIPPNLLGEV
jgi:hypothetical protein